MLLFFHQFHSQITTKYLSVYFTQVCCAGSRLLAQETIFDKLIQKLKDRLTHFRVGDSLDKTMDMGAIVDESQKASIEEYVESARKEGAEVVTANNTSPLLMAYPARTKFSVFS